MDLKNEISEAIAEIALTTNHSYQKIINEGIELLKKMEGKDE